MFHLIFTEFSVSAERGVGGGGVVRRYVTVGGGGGWGLSRFRKTFFSNRWRKLAHREAATPGKSIDYLLQETGRRERNPRPANRRQNPQHAEPEPQRRGWKLKGQGSKNQKENKIKDVRTGQNEQEVEIKLIKKEQWL